MNPQLAANFLVSGISLFGLVVLLLFFASDYRLDAYRQRLFQLRHELFNLALTTELTFEHPAYRLLNERINSPIRFAHRTKFSSLVTFVVVAYLLRLKVVESDSPQERSLRHALSSLPRHEQFKVISVSNQVDRALVRRLFFIRLPVDRTGEHLPDSKMAQLRKPAFAQAVESHAMKSFRGDKLSATGSC